MSTRILRARWLLPIVAPPVSDGWVEVAEGRIVRLGTGRPPGPAEDLNEKRGDIALMPGLVNAHTHVELSWLAGRVPPASSMVEWIRRLISERGQGAQGGAAGDVARQAIATAVTRMRASGTALAGDVTNSLEAVSALEHAEIGGVLFHELLGFRVADPVAPVHDALTRLDELERREQEFHWPDEPGAKTAAAVKARVARHSTVVAHAPYSTSPALFTEIARHRGDASLSVHLGESSDEIEFLHTGRGPFRHLLEELGAWDPSWQAPGCDPVEYLQRLGYLHEGCLIVHATHLTAKDRDMIREADAVVVTCPRSNVWVGVGLPPVTRFYDEGLRVAIGTDSLASSPTLSMFDELAELRRIAPEVDAGRLLESATRVGAEALGFPEFGTLAPGQRAVFATVRVPGGITDIEEYLVSGVPSGATSLLT